MIEQLAKCLFFSRARTLTIDWIFCLCPCHRDSWKVWYDLRGISGRVRHCAGNIRQSFSLPKSRFLIPFDLFFASESRAETTKYIQALNHNGIVLYSLPSCVTIQWMAETGQLTTKCKGDRVTVLKWQITLVGFKNLKHALTNEVMWQVGECESLK